MAKPVYDQQWFADGCGCGQHRGSDNQLPDVEAFATHHGNAIECRYEFSDTQVGDRRPGVFM